MHHSGSAVKIDLELPIESEIFTKQFLDPPFFFAQSLIPIFCYLIGWRTITHQSVFEHIYMLATNSFYEVS